MSKDQTPVGTSRADVHRQLTLLEKSRIIISRDVIELKNDFMMLDAEVAKFNYWLELHDPIENGFVESLEFRANFIVHPGVTDVVLNRWNRDNRFIQAYFITRHRVAMRMDVMMHPGALERLRDHMRHFELHVSIFVFLAVVGELFSVKVP